MARFDWRKILTQWSDAIIASGEYSQLLPSKAATEKWAGFPPATETAIVEAEHRLKLRLPESYRQFLKISNGWWLDGTAGPTRLWHVEEIRPMVETDPETVAVWSEEYDQTGDDTDPTDLPNSHFASVIQISDENDGRYLLNPLIKTHTEEWQAAFFASWVPGAECHDSFKQLMKTKFEAFLAAHPLVGAVRSSFRNLAKPPTNPITDEHQFVNELRTLGYFDFVSEEAMNAMISDFYRVSKAFVINKARLIDGPFASPGAVLLDPKSGRVVNLEIGRLVSERGRYAIEVVRPLLASLGIAFGPIEEQITADSYGVTLEGTVHEYFRLRKGRPSRQGGEHEINAARYVLYETAKLLNEILKQKHSAVRIATLEEFQNTFTAQMRLAFVLLNDELSYLFMWSPVIHNYCRPMRPDVFR